MTRQDAEGHPDGGFLPAERLSLADAIAGFTSGAAFAARAESDLGRLAPGRWCDVTVFDRDLFAGPPSTILEARVVATVIGGQQVWPLR